MKSENRSKNIEKLLITTVDTKEWKKSEDTCHVLKSRGRQIIERKHGIE